MSIGAAIQIAALRWVVAGLVPSAVAAPPAQQLADLEWRRESAANFERFARSPDPTVRRAAATALGRLQSTNALPLLERLLIDDDAETRQRAAFSLGITPGAAPTIRGRLDTLPAQARWGAPHESDRLRAALLESLGRHADPADIDRLVAATAEPGETAIAAAHALARLGRKSVDGVGRAVPALVALTARLDPRAVEAGAYALRRVTMKSATEADFSRVTDRAANAPTPSARAWLVHAASATPNGQQRAALITRALADPSPLVRIAALDQVRASDGEPGALAPRLTDDDEGVRAAAIAALGRLGTPAARSVLDGVSATTAAHQADLVRAKSQSVGSIDVERITSPSTDAEVRAALTESVTDLGLLTRLCRDDAAVVRSTAASRILELKLPLGESTSLALLDSADPVVRQAAVDRLAALAPPSDAGPPPPKKPRRADPPRPTAPRLAAATVDALVAAMRVETDPDVLVGGFAVLASAAAGTNSHLRADDALLVDTLIRGAGHPDAPVRDAAAAVARAIRVDVAGAARRSDVPATDLALARNTVGARVTTTRGTFTVELRPDVAPLAVANFARLADAHFYDRLTFHRVVPGFVVQTGDPRGDGSGGPGYTLPDELSDLDYRHGALGMARSGPDTAGSQWFVTTSNQPHLTGDYTLFGYVTSGLSVVDAIERGDQVLSITLDRVERAP